MCFGPDDMLEQEYEDRVSGSDFETTDPTTDVAAVALFEQDEEQEDEDEIGGEEAVVAEDAARD